MSEPSADPQVRFLERINRRVRCLESMQAAGLGVYLPVDEYCRTLAIEQMVHMTARQSELPHLTASTLHVATERIREHLEAMQTALPHDVQYRNRIRPNW